MSQLQSLYLFTNNAGKKPIPVRKFPKLDKILRLPIDMSANLGAAQQYKEELRGLHESLSKPGLSLYGTNESLDPLEQKSAKGLIDDTLSSLTQDAAGDDGSKLLRSETNKRVLKELLKFISSLESEPSQSLMRKAIKDYPLILVNNKNKRGNRRLIINPDLKEDASRCLQSHAIHSIEHYSNLQACDNAALSGDSRLLVLDIDDENYTKQTGIKYKDVVTETHNHDWERKAIRELQRLED